MISYRTALEQAARSIKLTNSESRLEAEILLCHILIKNRAWLFAHSEELISQEHLEAYQQLITQRAQGVPIAYITGSREFWTLSLQVNQHTLIPRHETERLVELALDLIPDQPDTHLLDLGTGSGAIALALAKERPHWHIHACDSSEDALETAKENARINGINNVVFYHSDWFKQLPPMRFQAIVSNPPYIPLNDPHLKQGDVRFEPQSALISGQDGLTDLQYIIARSVDYLAPDGLLLLEHGYDQKLAVCAILDEMRYKNIQAWKDISGHDRICGGWR